ncbi:MAG: phage holin family protein, partial [Burkholderiales bacterium]|nr:phage holin family protein [Burkholderiales bacterium]
MYSGLLRFLILWGVNTLSLWVADEFFSGIAFTNLRSLFIAGLLLGIVNT